MQVPEGEGGGSSVGGKEIIAASSFHVCVCVPSVPEIKALVLHGGRGGGGVSLAVIGADRECDLCSPFQV